MWGPSTSPADSSVCPALLALMARTAKVRISRQLEALKEEEALGGAEAPRLEAQSRAL